MRPVSTVCTWRFDRVITNRPQYGITQRLWITLAALCNQDAIASAIAPHFAQLPTRAVHLKRAIDLRHECAVSGGIMTSSLTIADRLAIEWNGRVPIMIGVTGHRNVDTRNEALHGTIREQCRALRSEYPSTPFVILSGLAEGADRLVARIAMEEMGAALVAVLPMPAEDYERDFESDVSKTEFRDLLARAFCIRQAPTPLDSVDWKQSGEARNQRYARAGAIIADHTQILFALWDGKASRGTGGTAEVVAWFDRGFAPADYSLYKDALSPLDPPEPGRRILIDPASADVSFQEGRGQATPTPSKRSRIGTILRRTEDYNCSILRHPAAVEQSYPLAPTEMTENTPAKFTGTAYHAADGLSVRHANSVRTADIIVYSLAMAAFFAFNFVNEWPVASWVYLGITLAMALIAGRVWFGATDDRFLEYRSLAEAMRVMFFWRVAGVRKPVWLAYLSRHSGVVHWIRHAVRSLEFCQDCCSPRPDGGKSQVTAQGLAIAQEHWVANQIRWFTARQALHRRNYRRWMWIARLAIGASFVIAALLAMLAVYHRDGASLVDWDATMRPYSDPLQIVLGVLAAAGLAARGFLARRADLELAKQYASQQRIFEIAEETLEKCENAAQLEWSAERILEQLGEEALQEQAEWLWLRHSRPFEVPN